VIYIGVSDEGEIIGASVNVRSGIDSAIRQSVKPQPPYRWRALRLQTKPVQALVIDEGSDKPYRAHKVVWIRVHATTREAEGHEIRAISGGATAHAADMLARY
jgi:predicted HTH transcriptional regulator